MLGSFELRRVVTGLGDDGRSQVILDGTPPVGLLVSQAGTESFCLWKTDGPRASNEGVADAAAKSFDIRLDLGSSKFIAVRFPPVPNATELTLEERKRLSRAEVPPERRTAHSHPGMHSTNSVDYVIMIEGELTLVLENEECILRAGDVLIDRGVPHAWENRGTGPAAFICVLIEAEPLGS